MSVIPRSRNLHDLLIFSHQKGGKANICPAGSTHLTVDVQSGLGDPKPPFQLCSLWP